MYELHETIHFFAENDDQHEVFFQNWVESNEMEKDALISIPKSMEEMLGSTDWIEVQTLLDTKTMSEYENWRKDDDNFEW